MAIRPSIAIAAVFLALSAPVVGRSGDQDMVALRASAGAVILSTAEKADDLLFVAEISTPVYSEKSKTSKVVWTMKPVEVAVIKRAEPGWLQVAVAKEIGWVTGISDLTKHATPATLENGLRIAPLKDHQAWTSATRFAIATQRPLIGFTTEQLEMALGDPLQSTEEQTANGTTTINTYVGKVVTISNGKVTKITTVK